MTAQNRVTFMCSEMNATTDAPLQVETIGAAEPGSDATLVVADIGAPPLPVFAAPSAEAGVSGAISVSASLHVDDRNSSGNWF